MALVSCSKEGPETEEEVIDNEVDAQPVDPTDFTEIVEFMLVPDVSGSVSVSSYDPALTAGEGIDNPTEILNADDGIVVPMNTDPEREGYEQVVIADVDGITVLDLETSEPRAVVRFSTEVCDIIPRQSVSYDDSDPANIIARQVHLNEVFVSTRGTVDTETCDDASNFRYYRLDLDYNTECLEIEDDVSVCPTLELSVAESRAKAEIVFGWEDDPDNPGSSRLNYGFLGYSEDDEELVLYGQDQNTILWRQERKLETIPASEGVQTFYHLTHLGETHYLAQLGRDIFAFEASEALFAFDQDDVDLVLSDRNLRLDNISDTGVNFVYSDDQLSLLNNGRLYLIPYALGYVPPATNYSILNHPDDRFLDQALEGNQGYFTQFDKLDCTENADPVLCAQADNTLDDDWQLIASCEVALGCYIPVIVQDICATQAELVVDPLASDTQCTPTEYLHLNELDEAANDATLVGYSQYDPVLRGLQFVAMQSDRLFMTVDLPSKDIFVQYNFERSLSEPKSIREIVRIGERFDTQGLDVYLRGNQLFATLLRQTGTRTNQCYAQGQVIECSDATDNTVVDASVCTALDRDNGVCVKSFEEYDSHAIYCDADALGSDGVDLGDGTCNDNFIEANANGILSADEDGKWLRVFNRETGQEQMMLLRGDEDNTQDEGQLTNPSLYFVDMATGLPEADSIGEIIGSVESVLRGTIRSQEVADLRLVDTEIIQKGSASSIVDSQIDTHFAINHSTAVVPGDPSTQRFIDEVESGQVSR